MAQYKKFKIKIENPPRRKYMVRNDSGIATKFENNKFRCFWAVQCWQISWRIIRAFGSRKSSMRSRASDASTSSPAPAKRTKMRTKTPCKDLIIPLGRSNRFLFSTNIDSSLFFLFCWQQTYFNQSSIRPISFEHFTERPRKRRSLTAFNWLVTVQTVLA